MAEKCVMEKVEDILTCSTCLEVLVDPKTFNCLHSYCRGCTERLQLVTQDSVEGYECPQCRRFTPKKEVRVVHLIVQLLDAYHAAKNTSKGSKCDQCGQNDASWSCLDCQKSNLLCDPCKTSHDKFSESFGTKHQVISLDELHTSRPVLDRPIFCTEHKDNKIEVFCTNCKKTICVLCKIFHHNDHEAEPIADAVKRLLSEIDASTKQIKEDIKENESEIETLKKEKEEIIKEYDEKIRKVEDKITEQNQVLAWVQTTTERTSGATLLRELQDGLLDKVHQLAGAPIKESRLWPLELVSRNVTPVKGTTINADNTGGYPYTRVNILWNMLWLLNHNTNKLYKYRFDGTKVEEIQTEGQVQTPRTAIQVNDTEALLAAKSGLYLVHKSGQIKKNIANGDITDVCVADGKIYALDNGNAKVVYLRQRGSTYDTIKDIPLQDYGQDNVYDTYNYVNTLVAYKGTLYVSMVKAHKLVQYDMSGKKLHLLDQSNCGFAGYPSLCGITSDNSLVICELNAYSLQKISNERELENMVETENSPWYATFQDYKTVWILIHPNILQQYIYT